MSNRETCAIGRPVSSNGYRRVDTELGRQGVAAGLELVRALMRAEGPGGFAGWRHGDARQLVGLTVSLVRREGSGG